MGVWWEEEAEIMDGASGAASDVRLEKGREPRGAFVCQPLPKRPLLIRIPQLGTSLHMHYKYCTLDSSK